MENVSELKSMATVENSVVYIQVHLTLTLTLARLVYKYCKYLLDRMMILVPNASSEHALLKNMET